jgi:UDP-glucose 6-dehydrogenase
MKNIGILGWGTVGRATAKHLNDPDRQIIAYDEIKDVAKHVNEGSKVKMVEGESYMDALIVCINITHPYGIDFSKSSYASVAANEITKAIIDCEVPLREDAPILVRTTVPPGTCDYLQSFFPNNAVMAWPEFSKEASMREGYEIKAPYLGLNPRVFDEDTGNGRIVAGMLLRNSELVLGAEVPDTVYTNKQVEFIKLAWNVKRATDVTVFNELTRGAVELGIDVVMAEHLVENAVPSAPRYSTLAFGGKCLEKDLHIWDASIGSTYGRRVRDANKLGITRALNMAFSAHELLALPQRPWVILGLQDGPSSGSCHHSPALQMSTMTKWYKAPIFVDTRKDVRDRFWWLLLKKGVSNAHARMAAPDDETKLSAINVIIIAQKSHGNGTYNALMRILQTSWEPVKLVINACNMHLHDHQIIEATKWGAVFVDRQEMSRMWMERDAERLKTETKAEVKALVETFAKAPKRKAPQPFLPGALSGA